MKGLNGARAHLVCVLSLHDSVDALRVIAKFKIWGRKCIYLRFIQSKSHEERRFFLQNMHDCKCHIDFIQQFNKQWVNIKWLRRHIACFCSISPTQNNYKPPQRCFASLSNMIMIRFWMIQSFKWLGSVTITHLLPVTFCHLLAIWISHFKYFRF